MELYPGAQELILKLKQARVAGHILGLGLLTGSYAEAIDSPLKHHKITDVFDAVITKSDELRDKPDPEGINVVLGRMGFDSTQNMPAAVMIGDTDKDILAAQAAGIDSIWVNHAANQDIYGKPQAAYFRSLQPTYEVSSLNEVEQILLKS